MVDDAQTHVTVLAGGLHAAKLVSGLAQATPEEQLHVVCNVGDDCEMWGLYVCPDIDRVLHTLSGELDPYRVAERSLETYHCLNRIRKLGMPSWLRISDRDMATHLVRSQLLRSGRRLDEVTRQLAELFGLGSVIMPVTNDPVRSRIRFGETTLTLGEFMSRNGHGGELPGVTYDDASVASPAPGVIESIRTASRVIVAPADPVAHIGPILAVPGVREALIQTAAPVIGVSPVVGSSGLAVMAGRVGPASQAMSPQPMSPSAISPAAMSVCAIAERYRDFLDHIVIHTSDLAQLETVQQMGLGVSPDHILMENSEDAERLAGRMLSPDRFGPKKAR